MEFGVCLALGILISSVSMAESMERLPMLEKEKEMFGMVDLKAGQCTVSFTDTETGWTPRVDLKPLMKRTSGNFEGGVRLQDWNNRISDREFIVTVQYFNGDAGRKILQTELYLNYGKTFTSRDIVKNSRNVVILDSSSKGYRFMEKFKVVRPGAYDETDLVTVPQSVKVAGSLVSFSRSANGVNVEVT